MSYEDEINEYDREEEFKSRDMITGRRGGNPLNKQKLEFGELDEIMLEEE